MAIGEPGKKTEKYHVQWNLGKHDDHVHKDEWI